MKSCEEYWKVNIFLINNIISKKSEVRYELGFVEGVLFVVVFLIVLDFLMLLNFVNFGRCKSWL